jgi:uncharacterized protein YjbI with pentapeptide repeats
MIEQVSRPVDLSQVNLSQVDLSQVDLSQVDLSQVDLSQVIASKRPEQKIKSSSALNPSSHRRLDAKLDEEHPPSKTFGEKG